MDVTDAGVIAESSAERIHRHHIFRVIILYRGKVAELALYSFIRGKQISYLNVHALLSFGCDKVYLADAKQTDGHIKALTTKVIPDHIFHHLFDAASQIGSAKIIADSMVGEIELVV